MSHHIPFKCGQEKEISNISEQKEDTEDIYEKISFQQNNQQIKLINKEKSVTVESPQDNKKKIWKDKSNAIE